MVAPTDPERNVMKYAIGAYIFDTDQLVLVREREVVVFRQNEAKLLALFLSEPDRIFSKEEILDKVWAGKVVAEQAVFQNVRNLRAIFGEEAIKTFSKKGYQWQLPISQVCEVLSLNSETVNFGAPSEHEGKTSQASFRKLLTACLLLCALVVVVALGWRQFTMPALPRLALIPLTADQELPQAFMDSLEDGLRNAEHFKAVDFNAQKVSKDFFWAPQKYFQTITQSTKAPYVFMGRVYQQSGNFRINYLLKSSKNSWGTEQHAATAAELVVLVNTHISRIIDSGLLDIDWQDSLLMGAKLKLLQTQNPQDLNILQALIYSQARRGDIANSLALVKELQEKATQQQNSLFVAKGHLVAANIYAYENLLADAEQSLTKAEAGFQALNDWENLADVEQARINVAFSRNDYEQIKHHVQRALEFSHRSGDVLASYHILTWAAVLANKFEQNDDRWRYLDSAEALLDQNKQAPEFYAKIHFYAGMFEETPAASEKRYRKVLAILPPNQDWWEQERAQAHLNDMLIKQERWQDALDIFANQPLNATQELLVGNIWKAQKNWPKAEAHGVESFKQASLNGDLPDELEAAIYLLQLDKQQARPLNTYYRQFVVKEAATIPHWIKFHKPQLDEIGLELPSP
jgi:DNA-binding winged helix-turn-helix (wHTH) protein/TolB-like protein